ncbi:MAG: cyclopropane-fatty-acyl-phospholipid synthase family protein [Actinomycetota bacterium]
MTAPLADLFEPLLTKVFGGSPPLKFEFWDDSSFGNDGPGRLRFNGPDAIRRVMWSPDELGLARAYVSGDINIDGNVAVTLRTLQRSVGRDVRIAREAIPDVIAVNRTLGTFGRPLTPPAEEVVPRGVLHSLSRDRQAVSHHYDVGNDFYRLVLGPSMTYSCARFVDADTTLDDAQSAKHDLICRKLGLHDWADRHAPAGERPRLLDVGCGWGSMAIHAATHFDVDAVGITISEAQAELARQRVKEAGVDDRVEIRLQDYREIDDGPYDAISSVGMAEHVGSKRMSEYFSGLYGLLPPGGRLLNHAIASVGGSKLGRRSFVNRYVFPDGELLDIADTIRDMEAVGFEVRDVENLREHYAKTLQGWVTNLEERWDEAVELVGQPRARVWLLYMSGSINGFDDFGLQLYQTLGVKLHDDGASDIPLTRADWI